MLADVNITILFFFIYIVKNPERILGDLGMNSDCAPISSMASDKSLSLSLLISKMGI